MCRDYWMSMCSWTRWGIERLAQNPWRLVGTGAISVVGARTSWWLIAASQALRISEGFTYLQLDDLALAARTIHRADNFERAIAFFA